MVLRKSPICGFVFVLLLFLSSFLGTLFIISPLLPLMIFKPKWWRFVIDEVMGSWITYAVSLMEVLAGIKIRISGDMFGQGESNLIIMNHHTRLDWMFLWMCLIRRSEVKQEKIILKSVLKLIPGAGWAMQTACYIFIERKWEYDNRTFTKLLDYFREAKVTKPQILLFPEGTDFTAKNKARSDEFACQNGLPLYEFVLHPRTTGFVFLASKMREGGMLSAVYDICIGYPQTRPQNEMDILYGKFPEDIHFHIKRHPVITLPIGDKGLQEWCELRWRDKEAMLKRFYAERHFTETAAASSGRDRDVRLLLRFCFVLWTSLVVVWLAFLLYSSVARWYALTHCVLFYAVYWWNGGMEHLEISIFNWWKSVCQ
ncbi:PREDICTED: lysocardiolipin acyltransferase 1-like [Priapulus caudatus]|uniref:Lysocardiolipin acyltransferase 1-like n=1 Tax=Priapulus caudatus TaxID=37621 RepID=A0ABM1EBC5_PRICU|nr:PREDICTED: lysocardiolipin acyltransferase 1-like [Priapulus caudatus]